MKINCNCIANDNGRCVAETCHGEIRTFGARPSTPEARRQRYACAVQGFEDYFSENYTDEDLEE